MSVAADLRSKGSCLCSLIIVEIMFSLNGVVLPRIGEGMLLMLRVEMGTCLCWEVCSLRGGGELRFRSMLE